MAYKTFEDMKHDIPEGATHYQNETMEFSFAWFNIDEDKCYVDGEWWPYSLDGYPMDEIKPIPPTIKTESPEEREALDMIGTTSKQVESLAKGDVVEWKNGDECQHKNGVIFTFIGKCDNPKEFDCVLMDSSGNAVLSFVNELSKPESPEQKAERERLEEKNKFIKSAIDFSYFTGSTETELILIENMFDSGKFKLVESDD